MKTLITIILTLTLAVPGFAKKKDPVYDKTGVVFSTAFRYDATGEATVNGEHYFAGCNLSETNASCSDTPGVTEVKFEDGRTMVLGEEAFQVVDGLYPSYQFGAWTVYSPLSSNLLESHKNSATFQYRIATYKMSLDKHGEDYMCVPFATKDKHDKPTIGEACYGIH